MGSSLGLPKSTRARLRYKAYVYLNPGAGSVSTQVFRANSLFDPDYTGVGHQPIGFDQLAAMYDHYIVTGSTARVTPVGNFANSTMCTLLLSDTSTGPTPWTTAAEQPGAQVRILQGNGSSSSTQKPMIVSFDAKTFFGVKDVIDNRDNLGALCDTNPADGAYFIVSVQAADMSADIDLGFLVELEYDAVFTERALLAAS